MDRLHASGLGGIVLLFLAPALLDALDAHLGLAVSSSAFRATIRLIAFGAVASVLYTLVRPPRAGRIVFEEETMCVEGTSVQPRRIPFRRISAAHAYGSGDGRRVIVGVRNGLPLSLPQAAFGTPEAVAVFLAAVREHVARFHDEAEMADYDARAELGQRAARGRIPVTICFVVLCTAALVVAITTRVHSDPLGMLRFGALSTAMVRIGEYERLISYVFVHWNLTHLWANVAPLIALGWTLERLLGWRLYSLMLLAATIAGSLLAMTSGGGVLRVGASGLVCAAFGILLFLNARRERELPPLTQVPMPLWAMLLAVQGFLLIAWIRAGMPSTGIDHLGHAFGWVAGATVAAVAVHRRSVAELKTLRTAALRSGPWIVAGVALTALTISAMRAIGFTRQDRVRAASALLVAPETPPLLRSALARETIASPHSPRREIRKAQRAVRMLLKDNPYDGVRLETLARAQARLGHSRHAIETARTTLLWHPDKQRAAAQLARLMWSRYQRSGSLAIGGDAPDITLERHDGKLHIRLTRLEAAQEKRGFVAYIVGRDAEELRGLLIVRIGGYLRDSYLVGDLPAWVTDGSLALAPVARTAFELVDLPEGTTDTDAYYFGGP